MNTLGIKVQQETLLICSVFFGIGDDTFVLFCVLFLCTGHFITVPLYLTYLHCLQHSVFEHLFNLYCIGGCGKLFVTDLSFNCMIFTIVSSGKRYKHCECGIFHLSALYCVDVLLS